MAAKIRRVRPPEDIPDSAMADVAFLLLIFFLATTTIADEFGLTLVLPAPADTSNPLKEVNRDNVMVVSTDEGGNVYLVDGEPIANLKQLQSIYRERYATNDQLIVSIEPHAKAPYNSMVNILDEMKAVKARRISLKTRVR